MLEPLVLDLDKDVQLTMFVPNLLVGAAKVDMGAETPVDTQLSLLVIHSLRLTCKAWKTMVDKSAEYNALRLVEYEYTMWPNDIKKVCLARKHYPITQFQENLKWFSNSRHVSSQDSRKILMANLGDFTLQKLVVLRDELEMSFCAVEFYGMSFHPGALYWTCQPIGYRWNLHFIAHIQPTYMWNPHFSGWPHEVPFYKCYPKDFGNVEEPNGFLGTPFFLCCSVFIYDVNYS